MFLASLLVAAAFCWLIYLSVNGILFQHFANKAISDNPNAPEMYYLRGCNHESFLNTYQNPFKSDEQHHEDWDREEKLALADFSKAVELAPDYACAYYHRGRCQWWHQPGAPHDNESIIADYKKALSLVPDDSQLHLELGRFYATINRKAEAIVEYQKAIELVVDEDRGNRVQRELQELQK